MLAVLGKKLDQTQRFLEDGTRIPVTRINVPGNVVVGIKTLEKNTYSAVAIAIGQNSKKNKKPILGIVSKAKLKNAPQLIKEVRIKDESNLPEVGSVIRVEEVFTPGDIIEVTGTSKGKGFAGGVKRYHFKGGPKTHGQSDRHRAPGSIGQGTTPGRVYKGKRMAGNMGHETVTVKNLNVIAIDGDTLLVSGLVPGPANNMLIIKKIGELGKKFVPLYKSPEQIAAEEAKEAAQVEQSVEVEVVTPEAPTESPVETKEQANTAVEASSADKTDNEAEAQKESTPDAAKEEKEDK